MLSSSQTPQHEFKIFLIPEWLLVSFLLQRYFAVLRVAGGLWVYSRFLVCFFFALNLFGCDFSVDSLFALITPFVKTFFIHFRRTKDARKRKSHSTYKLFFTSINTITDSISSKNKPTDGWMNPSSHQWDQTKTGID